MTVPPTRGKVNRAAERTAALKVVPRTPPLLPLGLSTLLEESNDYIAAR